MGELTSCMERGLRTAGPKPGWLERGRQQLHEAPQSVTSLSQLAHEAGVHPVYFARGFRKAFGCSVSEYLHERRLERAVELLEATDTAIGRIGVALGYNDHAHFNRAFRGRMGVSPSAYREIVTGSR